MAFDRSKFKGGSRKAQKEVQKSEPVSQNGKKTWHYIEEGRNELRLAPPHNPEHSSYELYRTANIDCNAAVWENGEKTDKTEIKTKKIISAIVHSEALKPLGEDADIMELYVRMVKDNAYKTIKDKKKREKYLAPVKGYRGNDKKWVWGIQASSSFLCYAWRDGNLGMVQLYSAWVRDMDKLSAELEIEGDIIEIDPFSNVDEGYPLIIMKDKGKDDKWKYVISMGAPSRAKSETYDDFFARTALTDGQLSELSKERSLYDKYVDSYKLSDFEMSLDGLKMFDEKNEFGIFEDDEFLDKCEKIQEILEADKVRRESEAEKKEEEEEEDSEENNTPAKVQEKKVAKPLKKKIIKVAPKVDKLLFVLNFVNDSYGEGFDNQIPREGSELDKWYELSKDNEDLPLVDQDEFNAALLPEVEEVEEEEEEENKVPVGDLASQIANLRNRKK